MEDGQEPGASGNDIPEADKSKGIEEAYRLAQANFESEEKRYAEAEAKAWRYIYIVFAILGLGLLQFTGEFRRIAPDHAESTRFLFFWSFVLFGACGFFSVVPSLLVLSVHRVPVPPITLYAKGKGGSRPS